MITEQAKQRACDLANEADRLANWKPSNFSDGTFIPGSMVALAQLCQDIADAVEVWGSPVPDPFMPFVLPKPAPDPLAEALRAMRHLNADEVGKALNGILAKSGYSVQPIKGEG